MTPFDFYNHDIHQVLSSLRLAGSQCLALYNPTYLIIKSTCGSHTSVPKTCSSRPSVHLFFGFYCTRMACYSCSTLKHLAQSISLQLMQLPNIFLLCRATRKLKETPASERISGTQKIEETNMDSVKTAHVGFIILIPDTEIWLLVLDQAGSFGQFTKGRHANSMGKAGLYISLQMWITAGLRIINPLICLLISVCLIIAKCTHFFLCHLLQTQLSSADVTTVHARGCDRDTRAS